MVSVLIKYKALFIVFALLVLAVLIWMFVSAQGGKVPSKGVFVLGMEEDVIAAQNISLPEGGFSDAAGNVKG